jgi:DNA polymerase/3'-5' exonuclease PolX
MQIKDIEIICEPQKTERSTDMFGGTELIPVHEFSNALHSITRQIIKGNIRGRHMQIITNSKLCPGIQLDLFMPQSADYFRQLAIRTGSTDYAHKVIAAAWVRKGWAGTHNGLRRQRECIKKSSGFICQRLKPTLPPVWKSEAEFFSWLGLELIDPEFRELRKTINEAI